MNMIFLLNVVWKLVFKIDFECIIIKMDIHCQYGNFCWFENLKISSKTLL